MLPREGREGGGGEGHGTTWRQGVQDDLDNFNCPGLTWSSNRSGGKLPLSSSLLSQLEEGGVMAGTDRRTRTF